MMKKLLILSALALSTISQSAFAAGLDVFDAARQGDIAALSNYVETGGDLEIRNRRGHTPFILAAYYGQTDAIKQLETFGANPCAVDEQGSAAFMGVVFKGHKDTLKWLLENTRCDVNHQNYAGQTALMLAALFDREEIAKSLITAGADPNIAD